MTRSEIRFHRPTVLLNEGAQIDYLVDFDEKTIDIRDGIEGAEFLAVLEEALQVAEGHVDISAMGAALPSRPSSRLRDE
jgi:hypothetical protein